MSIKDKIMDIVTSHPKLVTFGIGLGITFVIGTAIGMLDHNQLAFAGNGQRSNPTGGETINIPLYFTQ
jgi:hypothetical protein